GGAFIVGVRVSACPSANATFATPVCRKWTFGYFADGADRYQFSTGLSYGDWTFAESANAIVADVPVRLLTSRTGWPATPLSVLDPSFSLLTVLVVEYWSL